MALLPSKHINFPHMINALYCFAMLVICLVAGYAAHFIVDMLPASLYGMFFMALGLKTELIKPDKMEQGIAWIVKHMGVCFVPAGVGIMEHFGLLKQHGVTLLVICIVTSLLLMWLIGFTFQWLTKRTNNGGDGND